MIVNLLAGGAFGLAAGVLLMYWIGVRPLVNAITRMRYDGFRPSEPIQRPKTVPPPQIRED